MEQAHDERKKVMEEWGAWYGQLGASMVDGGATFGAAKHITEDDVADGPLGHIPAAG